MLSTLSTSNIAKMTTASAYPEKNLTYERPLAALNRSDRSEHLTWLTGYSACALKSEAQGFPAVFVECLDHKNLTTEVSRGYRNTRNIKSERLNPIQLLIVQFL